MLSVGTVLDQRYEIVELLATGGMGRVFRARRVLLGDEVAIKVILPSGDSGEGVRERFLRESRACAQLRHPNIVAIFDYDVDQDGHPFLVMEFLNGPSLRQELASAGARDLARVRPLVTAIGSALQLAHDRGIIHRDLKPANIVSHRYDSGEVVQKLIDFGIANMREPDETRLTSTHQFLGTVAYASPEQLRGETVDSRSDLYSFAAVIFELLTGRPPFVHDDPLTLATQHLTLVPPAPSSLAPDLPHWVDDVLLKALEKDRERRWASVDRFARALAGTGQDATTVTGMAPEIGAKALAGVARPGSTWLEKYELKQLLGRGRFGSEVYAGMHRALDHPVAIRILRRGAHGNWETVRDRFLREAKVLQVSHPSVIQVRDYGVEDDVVYVVTELIEGTSLRELLAREGVLPWARLSRLARQLIAAAGAVHRRGGLLCGMTPEIIRMTQDEDGERLLVSSGGVCELQNVMALLSEDALRGAGPPDAEMHYVAPELLLGEKPDVVADIFTLGVIVYEMATGRRPYAAATYPMLLGAMLKTHPADPRSLQADLPPQAAGAIMRAISCNRDDRPQTALAFAQSLGSE